MTQGPVLAWTSIPRIAKRSPLPEPRRVGDDGAALISAVLPRSETEADRTVPSLSRKTRTGSPGWSDL
jgi:hypothetical protein